MLEFFLTSKNESVEKGKKVFLQRRRNGLRNVEHFHAEENHKISMYMLIKALDEGMSTFRSGRKYFREKISENVTVWCTKYYTA